MDMSNNAENDVFDLDFTKPDLIKNIHENKELWEILVIWWDIFGRDHELLQWILTKRNIWKWDFLWCAWRLRLYCIREIQKNGGKKNTIIDNLTTLNRIFWYLWINKIYLSQLNDQVHDILQK